MAVDADETFGAATGYGCFRPAWNLGNSRRERRQITVLWKSIARPNI